MNSAHVEQFIARNLRWNYFTLTFDWVFYVFALSLVSSTTVMPAFARHLGASNLVIGAIPATSTLGFLLPGIFAANYIERLPLKLPFVMRYTFWERGPLALVAVIAFFFALSQPILVLIAFLAVFCVMTSVSGTLWPAWVELIAKTIPLQVRGRMYAYATAGGTFLGLLGTAVVGFFLGAFQFPINYSLCFAGAFVAAMTSYLVVGSTREYPQSSDKPVVGFATYMARLPAVLRRDRDFRWFLIVRSAMTAGGLANGFFTASALATFHAQEWQVGAFTTALLFGQTVGNVILGHVGDRWGHKRVLGAGVVGQVLANVLAFVATGVTPFYGVFALVGMSNGASLIANVNMAIEYAGPNNRPTYVALGSSAITPIVVAAPLLGGFVADRAGYSPVFALATLFSVLCAVILIFRVRDPRHRRVSRS